MIIQPRNAPELFLKIFGEYNSDTLHPDWTWVQRERAASWDAAIDHVFLRKPIQQKTPLTHPVTQKGD